MKSYFTATLLALSASSCNFTSGNTPHELFNFNIEENQRVDIARKFVASDWYADPKYTDPNGLDQDHTNIILRADGKFEILTCRRYGEIHERAYKTIETGEWEISAKRFLGSGEFYYRVSLSTEKPLNVNPNFIITREDGFISLLRDYNGSTVGITPLVKGARKDCP